MVSKFLKVAGKIHSLRRLDATNKLRANATRVTDERADPEAYRKNCDSDQHRIFFQHDV